MSKIAEKVILKRLKIHIDEDELIPHHQFGFRPGHSTVMPLCRTVQDAIRGYNKHQTTVLIQLDVEKAFDTVWRNGLLHKLKTVHRLPLHLVALLKSYMANRRIAVRVNNSLSEQKTLAAGVPQGTVLSPVLYTLYTADMPTHPTNTTLLFADDTTIYTSSFHTQAAIYRLQNYLDTLAQYFKRWKISINEGKSEYMQLTRNFKNVNVTRAPRMNDVPIPERRKLRMLGVTLDKWLSFKPHITNTIQRTYNTFRKLYSLTNRNSGLNTHNKTLLYKTILRPVLTYGCPAWCRTSNFQYKRLQTVQNKILRITTNSGRYDRIEDIHRLAKTPKIKDYIIEQSQKFFRTKIQNSRITETLLDERLYPRHIHTRQFRLTIKNLITN